ncbi:MAG: histidinol-phosphate transaminase [Treponema sp.]|jgi:histidinol-phosphate aminotransferase|nr:histidinol-phosphate transaminase [Treponema sp.]
MIHILTPKQYVNEPDALAKAGEYSAAYAKRIYIAAGKTALSKVRDTVLKSFDAAGIASAIFEHPGFPTHETALEIAARAKEFNAGAIAGIGGGRIMDVSKAAGHYATLPVIAIPTIAATCACWAAVSVLYTDEGVMTEPLYNEASPVIIIADTNIIAKAPPRYIKSGIADTLAKWYESYPNLLISNDFYLRLVTRYGEFARDVLERQGLKVVRDIENAIYNFSDIQEVIDCIFVLAGLCGAVRGLADTQGLAHPFYNASTAVPAMRAKLHGEKVACGLVIQAIIEGRELSEIQHRIDIFKQLGVPLTLSEMGIEKDFDSAFAEIADRMQKSTPRYLGIDRAWTRDELRAAILKVNELSTSPKNNATVTFKAAISNIIPFRAARSLESVKREFGLSEIIKLAGNENMHGASPKALAALAEAKGAVPFYPDTGIAKLAEALAEKFGVKPDELMFGNGSFELLTLIALSVLETDGEAIIPAPSFGWYTTSTRAQNAMPVFVPLREHKVDLDAIAHAITTETRLIWLCNPNNPTGTYVTHSELEEFLRRVPSSILVAIDEAYIDFAPPDFPQVLSLIQTYHNIISLRTFSKIYGLAGLRIGYAIGNSSLIEKISRVRAPVNVNAFAQEAALAALSDDEFYRYVINENAKGRELYYTELSRLGIEYIPTAGNFIMFNTRKAAVNIEKEYIKRGVLIRSGAEFGMDTWIRVTIGTESQNKKMLSILKEII